jgi:uncharacterized membrane protein YdfJ with MMPL/SSD domain
VAVGTTALLLVIAAPALGVHWSGIDASVLPTSKSARAVSDTVAAQFPPSARENQILVVASAPASARPALASYAGRLARVLGIAQASGPELLTPGTWEITLASPADPISAAGQQTVAAVRALAAPVPALVGGSAADFTDQGATIAGTLPLAVAILVVVTIVVLWLMTGSVILPVKALVMNALTAAAATGLLDRIREARQPGTTERAAVAAGMQRTGRLITSASILLAVALGAFATSKLVFLKEVGVGVAAAVLIDAFIVRALPVPSLMALLGRWNWWAPAPPARLHRRLGLAGTEATARRDDAGGRAGYASRPGAPR